MLQSCSGDYRKDVLPYCIWTLKNLSLYCVLIQGNHCFKDGNRNCLLHSLTESLLWSVCKLLVCQHGCLRTWDPWKPGWWHTLMAVLVCTHISRFMPRLHQLGSVPAGGVVTWYSGLFDLFRDLSDQNWLWGCIDPIRENPHDSIV